MTFLAILGAVAASWVSVVPQQSRATMTLFICDQIGVEPGIRVTAEKEVRRIFVNAGVDVKITTVVRDSARCGIPGNVRFFTVVLDDRPFENYTGNIHAMGAAVTRRGLYPRAYVFYDLVKGFVDRFDAPNRREALGQALAAAIAHELGHLLLPNEGHGPGVMRSRWSLKDWYAMTSGSFVFYPGHASAIRRELSR